MSTGKAGVIVAPDGADSAGAASKSRMASSRSLLSGRHRTGSHRRRITRPILCSMTSSTTSFTISCSRYTETRRWPGRARQPSASRSWPPTPQSPPRQDQTSASKPMLPFTKMGRSPSRKPPQDDARDSLPSVPSPRLLHPTDGKGARKPDPGVIYCKKYPYIEKQGYDIYGQNMGCAGARPRQEEEGYGEEAGPERRLPFPDTRRYKCEGPAPECAQLPQRDVQQVQEVYPGNSAEQPHGIVHREQRAQRQPCGGTEAQQRRKQRGQPGRRYTTEQPEGHTVAGKPCG